MIHVLGLVFNSCAQNSVYVRVSTLIDYLDSTVRINAQFVKDRDKNKDRDNKLSYDIGVCLVELLIERKLIVLKTETDHTEQILFYKSKDFKLSKCFAMCNFDISFLPQSSHGL